MSAGGAPSVRVDLDADLSKFAQKLGDARSQAESLIRSLESNQARLDIDTSEASRNLADISAEIASLSSEDASVLVEANTDEASSAITDLQTGVDALDGSAPTIDVEADASDAISEIESLTSELESLGDGVEPITLEVDADQAISSLEDVESHIESTGLSLSDVKTGLIGFGVGLGIEQIASQMIQMADAAAEDAASVARLDQSVINAEGSLRGHAAALDEAVAAGQELAFSDDAVREAIIQLTNSTGDADEALRRLSTAQNLARGANIDLVTAAKLLGRVSDENVGALRRYGVAVEDGATAQQLLNEVDRRFAGQAGTFAESDAGKFIKMADAVDESKEALGALLLPVMGDFASAIVDVTEGVNTLTGIIPQLSEALLGNEQAFGSAGEAAESYSEKLRDNGQAFAEWGARTGIDIATTPIRYILDLDDASDQASEGLIELFGRILDVARAAGEAEGPILGVANALHDLAVESGLGGQASDKYGGSLGRQAEYAGEANLANEALIETVESGNNVFAIAAYQMDLLAESAAGLAGIQGNINDVMAVFSSQGSEYSSTQSALTDGYEALQEKQAAGLELSASEQQYLEEYPTLLGRVEGAQQDATIQEGLAAAAKVEVMQAQDELNQAIQDGDKDLGPYQEHLRDAQGLLNDVDPNSGMQLALDNLGEAIGVNLPQKIDELIAALGELDGTKAEPEVSMDTGPFAFARDGANEDMDALDGRTAESTLAADKTPFDDTVDGANSTLGTFDEASGSATLNADDTAFLIAMGAAEGRVAGFNAFSGTATLYLNTDPFYAALEQSAAMLPHSPAEEGPLAFEPDWSYLTEGMSQDAEPGVKEFARVTSEEISEPATDYAAFVEHIVSLLRDAAESMGEGLESAKLFADTGIAAIQTFNDALDLMNALGDQALVLGENHHQSIEALNHLIYRVVQLMAQDAESISGDYLAAGKEFAAGAEAGAGAFSSGLELLTALDEQSLTLTEGHHRTLEAVNHLLYKVVALMAQSAESLNGPGLDAAIALSQATSEVVGAFADTLHFLQELAADTDRALIFEDELGRKVDFLVTAATIVAQTFSEAARTWDAEINPAVEAFSAATSDSIGALSDALSFLQAIAEDVDRASIYEDALGDKVDFLVTTAAIVARSFADAASRWDDVVNPSIAAFAAAAGDSFGPLGDALSFLQALADDTDRAIIYEDALGDKVNFLVTTAEIVAHSFADAAARWDVEVTPAVESFSAATGESLSALNEATAFLNLLSESADRPLIYEDELGRKVDFLVTAAIIVAQAFAKAAVTWDGEVNPQVAAFAEAAGDSLGLMGDAADAIESILSFGEEGGPENVSALAKQMVAITETVVEAVSEAAELWSTEGIEAAGVFAENASKAVGLMSDVAGAYEAMAEMSEITEEDSEIFFHNWQIILDMIPRLVAMAEPYLDDAERFHEIALLIAEEFAAAAEAIQTVAGDAAKTVGGAAAGANKAIGFYSGATAVDDISTDSAFDPYGTKNGGGSGGSGGGGSSIYDLQGIAAETYRSLDPTPSLGEFSDWKAAQIDAGLLNPNGTGTAGFYNTYYPGQLSSGMGGMSSAEMHDAVYAGARAGAMAGTTEGTVSGWRNVQNGTRTPTGLVG